MDIDILSCASQEKQLNAKELTYFKKMLYWIYELVLNTWLHIENIAVLKIVMAIMKKGYLFTLVSQLIQNSNTIKVTLSWEMISNISLQSPHRQAFLDALARSLE